MFFLFLAMLQGIKSIKERKREKEDCASLSASSVMLQTVVHQDMGSDLSHIFSHILKNDTSW